MNWFEKIKRGLRELSLSLKYDLERTNRSECAAILLSDVRHPEHYFYLKGNIPVKNLSELSDVMKEMDDETFSYHVGEGRNDFSSWVKDIIGDNVLAGKLNQLKSREEMNKAVEVRVNYIRKRAEQRY